MTGDEAVRYVGARPAPPPLTIEEIEVLDSTLETSSECLRPGCSGKRQFRRTRQGRQQRFCSDKCRAAYGRRRGELIDTWVRLRWTQGYEDLPVPSAALDRLLSRVKWLLESYGSPDLSDRLLPKPPLGAASVIDAWLTEGELPANHPAVLAANASAHDFYRGRRTTPAEIGALPRLQAVDDYLSGSTRVPSDKSPSIAAVPVDESPRFGIGYWRSTDHPELPDPAELVDESQDEGIRSLVSRYFAYGTLRVSRSGQIACHLCDETFPDVDFTDGEYVWPMSLAHYVDAHAVRLPYTVERYVLLTFRDVLASEADTDWWVNAANSVRRQP